VREVNKVRIKEKRTRTRILLKNIKGGRKGEKENYEEE
jgi:hypothetical protein